MRTPEELLERADEILLLSKNGSYSLEAQYWAGTFAAAHVNLAMGISAIGAIDRGLKSLEDAEAEAGYVSPA